MTKQLMKDAIMWGFILWLIGYILGIVFFMILPPALIGWVITPLGILITLWVLFKKIKPQPFHNYVLIAGVWTLIAIVCDYFLLVQVFKPADGYYKLDVYIYYAVTFLLPLLVGWKRKTHT